MAIEGVANVGMQDDMKFDFGTPMIGINDHCKVKRKRERWGIEDSWIAKRGPEFDLAIS